MARPARIQAPDLIRHVMSRGNGKMPIFLDRDEYQKFIDLLACVASEFGLECWNYCVMPNHYHATLRPTRANLSDALQRLNGMYGRWWNRRHERIGHVFQGRFKGQIVDRESYLLALSRYVVMNPVRAGLVDRPEAWPWSSYSATVGLRPAPSFLSTESTLQLFAGRQDCSAQERFAEWVMTKDDPAATDWIRSNERVLGSRAFRDAVAG